MEKYRKIKSLINESDAILVGVSDDLSLNNKEEFKKIFPELTEKYGMTDFYTASFYDFKTEEERILFWSKYIDYFYNNPASKAYINLFKLLKDKNYFVITTKVDNSLIKAGFDREKVFNVNGDLSKMQCAVGCHNKLYDNLDMVKKILNYKDSVKLSKKLIPYCPICEGRMEVNLRKDAFFVEDDNWKKLNYSYSTFVNDNKDKKLLLIEIQSDPLNPNVIRYPFEKMTYDFKNTNLIRISENYADVPFEIKLKSIIIKDNYKKVIDDLIRD